MHLGATPDVRTRRRAAPTFTERLLGPSDLRRPKAVCLECVRAGGVGGRRVSTPCPEAWCADRFRASTAGRGSGSSDARSTGWPSRRGWFVTALRPARHGGLIYALNLRTLPSLAPGHRPARPRGINGRSTLSEFAQLKIPGFPFVNGRSTPVKRRACLGQTRSLTGSA